MHAFQRPDRPPLRSARLPRQSVDDAAWRAPLPAPADAPPRWPSGYPDGYAVVDVETTGLSRSDRVVSVGLYRLDRTGEAVDHWYTPVNPERDPGPVWIHGLTSEMLEDAPTFPEIAEELAERLGGRVMVAHNALFDWNMIAREYLRAGGRAPVDQRLCTIVLARDLALPLANHKLATLAGHFGVRQRRAHHALDDARVLAEVFRSSLRLAAAAGLELPLHPCIALTDVAEAGDAGAPAGRGAEPGRTWRPHHPGRRLPASPYPNPGRWREDGPLVQGMRVAFSGDTAIERELLEDRAVAAGLHVATSVSRLTSLLVTNDPRSRTSKGRRAREVGTPVVDEPTFLRLLRDVAPHPGGER